MFISINFINSYLIIFLLQDPKRHNIAYQCEIPMTKLESLQVISNASTLPLFLEICHIISVVKRFKKM